LHHIGNGRGPFSATRTSYYDDGRADPIADIYTDGVGAVEVLGGNVRVIYYTWEGPPGERNKVVVAKLVMPINAVTERALGKMLSEQLAAQRVVASEEQEEDEEAADRMPIPGLH
jgi:hypothetical protein